MHEVTMGGFLQDLLNQFFLILLGIWWLCRARSLPPQWSLTGSLAYTLGIFYKKCSKQNIFSQKWPPEGVEGFITMLLIKRVQYQSFRHPTWYLGTCKANTENIRQHFCNNSTFCTILWNINWPKDNGLLNSWHCLFKGWIMLLLVR